MIRIHVGLTQLRYSTRFGFQFGIANGNHNNFVQGGSSISLVRREGDGNNTVVALGRRVILVSNSVYCDGNNIPVKIASRYVESRRSCRSRNGLDSIIGKNGNIRSNGFLGNCDILFNGVFASAGNYMESSYFCRCDTGITLGKINREGCGLSSSVNLNGGIG